LSVFHISRAFITILSYLKSIYHNSNNFRICTFSLIFSNITLLRAIPINYGYYEVIAQRHSIGARHIYRVNVNNLSVWLLKQRCLSIIISNQRRHFKMFSGYKCVIKLFISRIASDDRYIKLKWKQRWRSFTSVSVIVKSRDLYYRLQAGNIVS
jgi:hypothetical protein